MSSLVVEAAHDRDREPRHNMARGSKVVTTEEVILRKLDKQGGQER